MRVLQGDVNKSTSVLAQDYADVKKKFFTSSTAPGPGGDTSYNVFNDIDGTGTILARDVAEVKKRFFQNLPAAPAATIAAAPARSPALFGAVRVADAIFSPTPGVLT
jgi:hypothetical protein